LIERLVDDVSERPAHTHFQIFADSVEDDDRIVDGKTNDCQDRSYNVAFISRPAKQ